MSNQNEWMNNPKLKNIDKNKLEIIMALANQTGDKKQSEIVPFLLAAASQSKKKGVNFSSEEIDLILEVMKTGKSEEEVQRMDKLKMMMSLMNK